MLLCGDAARNVLIRVRRVLGEGAKTRNQRRKRHDEEGRESLHLGARGRGTARLALGRRDLQVRVIGRPTGAKRVTKWKLFLCAQITASFLIS